MNTIDSIKHNLQEAQELMTKFTANTKNFSSIKMAGELLVETFQFGNKVISCGNGGSMCNAIHFAEKLCGRFRNNRKSLGAIAISDPSYLTAAAKYFGYDKTFARFVEGTGKKGDVLLAISTSGNSISVVNAIKVAKIKEIKVIGLTGKDGGKISELCDVEIRAPFSLHSERIQEIHLNIIHSLIHFVESNFN